MRARLSRYLLLVVIGACCLFAAHAPARGVQSVRLSGPGLSGISPPGAPGLFLAEITGAVVPSEHGQPGMHDGYLVLPFSREKGFGGFAFFDVSNPLQPQLRSILRNWDTREAHAIGFHHRGEELLAATPGSFGIHLWDWSDVRHPRLLNRMLLPGIIPSDYSNSAWWVFWQAPYLYVSGASNGLYIIDTHDPSHPVLRARTSTDRTGGFRVGSVHAIGNLLVLGGNEVPGIALLDIGDPVRPKLLAENRTHSHYSITPGGNKLYGTGLPPESGVLVYDIGNSREIVLERIHPFPLRLGYLQLQDRFLHVGASELGYAKLAMDALSPGNLLHLIDFPQPRADVDFAMPLGSLAVLSDDKGNGSRLALHAAEPDRTGPEVTMVVPASGTGGQPRTTRIGITFSDQIDLRTVNESSFIVQEAGGAVVAGLYSGQHHIVNFAPARALRADTAYQVILPKGGVRDLAGNALGETFVAGFSTGAVARDIRCVLDDPPPAAVGDVVRFEARCDGEDLLFAWAPGDGTPRSAPAAAGYFEHRYSRAGHYRLLLTVHDGRHEVALSASITIVHTLAAARPERTRTIELEADANRLWVVNPDNSSIAAIDAARYALLFETPVGNNPRTLALVADTVWTANREADTISIVDRANGRLTRTITLPYGSMPYGVLAGRNSNVPDAVFVTLEGTGEVAMLHRTSGALLARTAVGRQPRFMSLSADGSSLFVARFLSDPEQGEIVELALPQLTVRRRHPLGPDAGPDTALSGRGVPNYLMAISVSPDGRTLWVPAKKDNTERGVYRDGRMLTFENTVRAAVLQLDLSGAAEQPLLRRDLDNRGLPGAVAFTRLGDFAFVPTITSNTVEVLDAFSGATVDSLEDAGRAPIDVLLDGEDARLFVHSELTREIIVYDVRSVGRRNTFPRLARAPTVIKERMHPAVLRGKQIFFNSADERMSRKGYLACASCHLDGESDERVWDFTDRGEGLRNTLSLRGAAHSTGMLHWSANFDELQDFELDIRQAFGGSGFLPDDRAHALLERGPLQTHTAAASAELDALAAYIQSLAAFARSPYREANGALTVEGARGKELFDSAEVGCSGCHGKQQGAADATVEHSVVLKDVGTLQAGSGARLGGPLRGLDTPPLGGLWMSAPYFHDGSASTLEEVIARNVDDNHGRTSQLSAADKAALVSYLRQIENVR